MRYTEDLNNPEPDDLRPVYPEDPGDSYQSAQSEEDSANPQEQAPPSGFYEEPLSQSAEPQLDRGEIFFEPQNPADPGQASSESRFRFDAAPAAAPEQGDEPEEARASEPEEKAIEPDPASYQHDTARSAAIYSGRGRSDDFEPESDAPSGTEMLLTTQNLVKIYDGRAVVKGAEINVRPGEIVGLLGPNGAGKTTTFYMIVGLVPPNGGEVIFNGADVTHEPMYKRARLGMGYLPQEESIFRKLTVEQNIMAVMETLDLSRSERQERTRNLMNRFGIDHIGKNLAMTCSGGEKRRLTIARSLVTEPNLLMLDEPFSGVDPIAVGEIQGIVRDLKKAGLAILITDHNVRETLEIVDRAYLIFEGQVLREGTKEFLINDPVSRELYLGERFSM